MGKRKVVDQSQSDYEGQVSRQSKKAKTQRKIMNQTQGSHSDRIKCSKCDKVMKRYNTLYNHVHGPLHKKLSKQEKREIVQPYKKAIPIAQQQIRKSYIEGYIKNKTTPILQNLTAQLRWILRQILQNSHQQPQCDIKQKGVKITYCNMKQIQTQLQRLKREYDIQEIDQILQLERYLRHQEDKGFRRFICIHDVVKGLTVENAAKIQLGLEIIAAIRLNEQQQIVYRLIDYSKELWKGNQVIQHLLQSYYLKIQEILDDRQEKHGLAESAGSNDESQMMEEYQ